MDCHWRLFQEVKYGQIWVLENKLSSLEGGKGQEGWRPVIRMSNGPTDWGDGG